MSSNAVVESIGRHGCSAILRTSDASAARPAMDAAIRGGFRVVEFTLTTPGAIGLIEEYSKREGLLVGAGTVLTTEDVGRSVRAGARYIVSPVTDEEVIETALSLGAAPMPGAHTPTELLRAHKAGAVMQKLFPAPAGGPVWVKSVLAPLSFLKIVPTNGVTAENAAEWLAAGVFAVGFAANLFDPADIAAKRFERIEDRARKIVEAVEKARGAKR